MTLLMVLALHRWQQMGATASGTDPGNWFAVGRQFFGQGGKSSDVGYPPLIPVMLHLGQEVADPMIVAKVVATVTYIAIAIATYVVARASMEPWFALMCAVLVGSAGHIVETMAFGGYPQNLAFAFSICGALFVARFLSGGERRQWAWATAALACTALTHHMYFVVVCAMAASIWLVWLTIRPARSIVVRRSLALGAAGLVAIGCFVPTFVELQQAGFAPALNPSRLDTAAALRYGIRESPGFWQLVFGAGLLIVGLTWPQRREPVWQIAVALMSSSTILFLISAEPRFIPSFSVGAVLAVGLALQGLWDFSHRLAWRLIPVSVLVLLPALLWPRTEAVAGGLFDFYRVSDESLVEVAAFVDQHHDGGTVIVDDDQRGWPVGWWFEGLTSADVAVGSKEQWLAFPEEVSNARLARTFFKGSRTSHEAREYAARHDVTLLVFRKWDWIGWMKWQDEPNSVVAVVYDDDTHMVVNLQPDGPVPDTVLTNSRPVATLSAVLTTSQNSDDVASRDMDRSGAP